MLCLTDSSNFRTLDSGKEVSYQDFDLGSTFIVSVITSFLGVVQSVMTFTFAPSSGDGPFFKCCHECVTFKHDPGTAVSTAFAPLEKSIAIENTSLKKFHSRAWPPARCLEKHLHT